MTRTPRPANTGTGSVMNATEQPSTFRTLPTALSGRAAIVTAVHELPAPGSNDVNTTRTCKGCVPTSVVASAAGPSAHRLGISIEPSLPKSIATAGHGAPGDSVDDRDASSNTGAVEVAVNSTTNSWGPLAAVPCTVGSTKRACRSSARHCHASSYLFQPTCAYAAASGTVPPTDA